MTQREIAKLLSEYHAAKVAAAKADSIAKEIKAYMTETGENRLEGGGYIATMSTFTTTRVDTTAMKKAMPDVVAQYTTTSEQQRLTIK